MPTPREMRAHVNTIRIDRNLIQIANSGSRSGIFIGGSALVVPAKQSFVITQVEVDADDLSVLPIHIISTAGNWRPFDDQPNTPFHYFHSFDNPNTDKYIHVFRNWVDGGTLTKEELALLANAHPEKDIESLINYHIAVYDTCRVNEARAQYKTSLSPGIPVTAGESPLSIDVVHSGIIPQPNGNATPYDVVVVIRGYYDV